ncbi:trypsin-like peptidase domain-containing protein [Sphingomonas aurantiaca]|uniref:S1C family serine protease n=1 Tax=Sphingomonas aurantiaca TaxID=185949 RepID=UPI002FDFB02F
MVPAVPRVDRRRELPEGGDMIRLLLLLALTFGLASSASADDIAATGRGVVRVVTIAVVDDQVVGFGHGSGFAVAPNRIVTNAHVVDLAERYPDNVVVGIVPTEGTKSYQGKVIAYDSQRDLALIEFTGARLPPSALYTGPMNEGDAVVSLGFPGNVDLATARSAADYIRPMTPVRSEGVLSGRRVLSDIEVLLHTASIARGNSGGPLLDRCGRVIGVNSAITRGEEGDSTFGFAIADTELAGFLRDSKQPYASIGTGCTSIEDRLRQDSDADARATADAASARRDAAAQDALAREGAVEKARTEAAHTRENVMAIAGLLLVAGALVIGSAGLLESRGQRRRGDLGGVDRRRRGARRDHRVRAAAVGRGRRAAVGVAEVAVGDARCGARQADVHADPRTQPDHDLVERGRADRMGRQGLHEPQDAICRCEWALRPRAGAGQ